MADKTVYFAYGLIGGGANDLDFIDGSVLLDQDVAHVYVGDILYIYILDDDSGAGESSPTIISPDANAGTKRWILQHYRSIEVGSDANGDTYYRASNVLARLAIGAAGALMGANAGQTAIEYKSVIVSADGEMTNPSQPAFLAHPTAPQTDIAKDGYVTVVFGTERFDQTNDFASNTFTAPITGLYQFSYSINIEQFDTAATTFQVELVTSNKTYYYLINPPVYAGADGMITFTQSILADMDAADTVLIRVYQTGGTQQADIMTASFFSGYLAC